MAFCDGQHSLLALFVHGGLWARQLRQCHRLRVQSAFVAIHAQLNLEETSLLHSQQLFLCVAASRAAAASSSLGMRWWSVIPHQFSCAGSQCFEQGEIEDLDSEQLSHRHLPAYREKLLLLSGRLSSSFMSGAHWQGYSLPEETYHTYVALLI